MKNRLRVFIFIFFLSLLASAKSNSSTKSVSVSVELEEMPNVKTYEIEIKKNTSKKQKQLNFSQKDSLFKIKLEVGSYQFRTRIVSIEDEAGPWSDWSELLAAPDEVAAVDIPSPNLSIRKNQATAELDLKWQKANGAEKYTVWIEDQISKTLIRENTKNNNIKLKLKLGEYKIGVQSVSKDSIRSKVKYAEDFVFVAKTQLPKIQIVQKDLNSFNWTKQRESDVKIEIYRKPFFGDKYVKVQTLKESGDKWFLPRALQPGEYKIDFQYVSDSFENGPIHTVSFLKKPDEKDFSSVSQ